MTTQGMDSMPGSCCARPIARIVAVGNFEAGIVGLDSALASVYESGIDNDDQIATVLIKSVREFGNYVSSSAESEYKSALLREYRGFVRKKEIGK
jgi:hypothetical protein